jgi:UDP-N-acetylglucosamine 2-epimerase (non-hydrolysing)
MTLDSKTKHTLMVVVGTRPEAIKLAPVILEARARPDRFTIRVVVTGQHREMLDRMLHQFGIEPDVDLDIMKPDQNLVYVTCSALEGLYDTIAREKPDCVIVQGDTTTTFAGALAAFYQQVAVAHVEAGLRTFDKTQPWPEEINRCLTGQLTDFHFAPTPRARENLLREGIPESHIWVTGNTAIDSLFLTLDRDGNKQSEVAGNSRRRKILLTAHRRENFGKPMERICNAVLRLVDDNRELTVVYPVHKSPRVRRVVHAALGDHPRIEITEPMDYTVFVRAMTEADLILTDSGGIQEEAPSLGTPVLVMRETTERPEAIEAGVAMLVGTDEEKIFKEVRTLLTDNELYNRMAKAANPYGDGTASRHILDVLADNL